MYSKYLHEFVVVVSVVIGLGLSLRPALSQTAIDYKMLLTETLKKVRSTPIIIAKPKKELLSGIKFSDCRQGCPSMIVVPSGTFNMGSRLPGKYRLGEKPVHEVRLARPFAVGRFEVTFGEYLHCVEEKKCLLPRWIKTKEPVATKKRVLVLRASQTRYDSPVTSVSWYDAKAYANWLSRKTGEKYRLLTESEWEYVAKAGKGEQKYWWGDKPDREYANYGKDQWPGRGVGGRDKWLCLVPVGSFPANPFGIYDLHGNALEWIEDCYHRFSYRDAPKDGGAWYNFSKPGKGIFRRRGCRRKLVRGPKGTEVKCLPQRLSCSMRVMRGGYYGSTAEGMRSSRREGMFAKNDGAAFGFRLARDIR